MAVMPRVSLASCRMDPGDGVKPSIRLARPSRRPAEVRASKGA